MPVLIGNTVKTAYADYPCATREEAEALFMALKQREEGAAERREVKEKDRTPAPRRRSR